MSTFSIKTGVFEGPLEVLLSLIEEQKLLINDVSLAFVTDEFISYVEKLPELPLSQTASFVSTASTLLLIKSKSLLPNLSLTAEEEGDIRDLERRLAAYQIIRRQSKALAGRFGKRILFPGAGEKRQPIFAPSRDLSLEAINQTAQDILTSLPKLIQTPSAVVKKILSLEEMIVNLCERINKTLELSFQEFSKGERETIIVSFLALLELIKRGVVIATQEGSFSDILLRQEEVSLPRYE